MEIKKIVKHLEKLLGADDKIDIDTNDPSVSSMCDEIKKARTRLKLTDEGIGVEYSKDTDIIRVFRMGSDVSGSVTKPLKKKSASKNIPVSKRHQHSYVAPHIAKDIIDLLVDDGSHVIQLVGPTMCGKTTLVHHIGSELNRKVFQINCRGDMGSESFIGEKTVEVDTETKQNKIIYQKGIVEQAMVEGMDEDGKESGPAAILFIDEITACPAHVAHVLNRLFESDDPRRTLVLDQDGGRVVRSHSKFRIVVAGNNAGRGAQGLTDSVYAAQLDALDLSLLHRISACFRMGYNKTVERNILVEKIGDDKVAQLVIEFRDAIRAHIKSNSLTTPFSTKNIVDIADLYRVYSNLGKAVFYAVIEHLMPEERAIYNETAVAILGEDILNKYVESNVDYL